MAKAKFDIKTEATRSLFAGVGAADLAVEAVRDYFAEVQTKFADVQKNVAGIDYTPAALREQATTVVDTLAVDAKATRATIESRVAELVSEFQAELETLLKENVATVNDTYADLAKRGEVLVERFRNQESTKATVKSAKTTVAKAKTTKTQAEKTAAATKTAAKSTAKTTKKTATKTAAKVSQPAKKEAAAAESSAKATVTAAKKTATSAAEAVREAAEKIGD